MLLLNSLTLFFVIFPLLIVNLRVNRGLPPRPAIGDPVVARNATGAYTGRWDVEGASPGVALHDVSDYLPFENISFTNTTLKVKPSVVPHRKMRYRVKLVSPLAKLPQLLTGTVENDAGTVQYLLRGELVENGTRLAVFAVPAGLKPLILNKTLPANKLAVSFLKASDAVLRFSPANTSLVLGPPRVTSLGSGNNSVALPTELSDAAVRKQPSKWTDRSRALWDSVSRTLSENPCLWFGVLSVSHFTPPTTSFTFLPEEAHVLTGNLVSLTCNATLVVDVGQKATDELTDKALYFLIGGMVLSFFHTYATYQQTVHPSTQPYCRSWVSILLVYLATMVALNHHLSVLRLPALLKPSLVISFLNVVSMVMLLVHVSAIWTATGMQYPQLIIFSGHIFVGLLEALSLDTYVMCLLWIPQIFRNVKLKVQRPICIPLLLSSFAYFVYFGGYKLACPSSTFLVATYSPTGFAVGTAFLGAQTVLMLLQRFLGPTFCIPSALCAFRGYNYHQPLPQQLLDEISHRRQDVDVEMGHTTHTTDCVICQNAIDTSSTSNYMLPPCQHLFHTECLEEWMTYKLECPVCRRKLPV